MKMSMADRRTLNRMSNIDWETERLLSRNKDLLRNPKSRLVHSLFISNFLLIRKPYNTSCENFKQVRHST